jgi:hypothetical protein
MKKAKYIILEATAQTVMIVNKKAVEVLSPQQKEKFITDGASLQHALDALTGMAFVSECDHLSVEGLKDYLKSVGFTSIPKDSVITEVPEFQYEQVHVQGVKQAHIQGRELFPIDTAETSKRMHEAQRQRESECGLGELLDSTMSGKDLNTDGLNFGRLGDELRAKRRHPAEDLMDELMGRNRKRQEHAEAADSFGISHGDMFDAFIRAKRDHRVQLAAAALQGLLAKDGFNPRDYSKIAVQSVAIADAVFNHLKSTEGK